MKSSVVLEPYYFDNYSTLFVSMNKLLLFGHPTSLTLICHCENMRADF